MTTDANGLEILLRSECLELLRSCSLGRIATSASALPVILPVNYVVDGDDIVVRTRPHTQLASATNHTVVAFEADQMDPVTGEGWSVLVQGSATRTVGPGPDTSALARWIEPGDDCIVRITTDLVTGRRVPRQVS